MKKVLRTIILAVLMIGTGTHAGRFVYSEDEVDLTAADYLMYTPEAFVEVRDALKEKE